MLYPSLQRTKILAKKYNRIPVYRQLNIAEPGLLMVLKTMSTRSDVVFLESADSRKKQGRFSYLGFNPVRTVKFMPPSIIIEDEEGTRTVEGNYFDLIEEALNEYNSPSFPGYGTFNGGYAGYLGFEMVNYTGILRRSKSEDTTHPSALFFFIDDFICYDNKKNIYSIATAIYPESVEKIEDEYIRATRKLEALENQIIREIEKTTIPYIPAQKESFEIQYRESSAEFTKKVEKTKELIRDGEALQVVLSMRADIIDSIDPYRFYLKLRQVNPSPYMFYIQHNDLVITGSSPEIHVKISKGKAQLRPIAGTIAQGSNHQENIRNKASLLNDKKERAEHLMLVDLARNDLSREALPGSVQVTQFMEPEDYSHVIHLVSQVQATLREDVSTMDVIKSTFPAGTVSGAPKVRAIEIIEEMESHPRGIYAGAVGYLGFNGETDTCITIRTGVFSKKESYIQAGAGIVYDSQPISEYHEIRNKLRALSESLPYAKNSVRKEEDSNVLCNR